MSAPRYASLSDLRTYLSSNGDLGTADDALLVNMLLRAETQIDNYTRRSFGTTQGTIAYSRWTAQAVGPALYLDEDLYAIAGGTVYNGDGQIIPAGSIWLEPRNEGPPYRILRLKSAFVWSFNTDSEILIPAARGYSAVAPADIAQATIELAAYHYRRKDVGPTDVSGMPDSGEVTYPKGIPETIKAVLSPYRSRSGGAV